jgi:FkbM family methyltransferase
MLDTRALLDEAIRAAALDPLFGLPGFARELATEGLGTKKLVIFGTGEFSSVFFKTYGTEGVLNFVADDRPGQTASGVECISSKQFIERYTGRTDVVAINCARWDVGVRHFVQLGLRTGVPVMNPEQGHRALRPPSLDYRLADHLPTIVANARRYEALEARMADEYSKESLRRVLLFHLTTDKELFRHIERPYNTLYFRSGLFEVSAMEQFVDCGASIGESISGLLGLTDYRCERAWLFEPDKLNGGTLTNLLAELEKLPTGVASRIRLHPVAVGENPDTVAFSHVGGHGGSILPQATGRTDCDETPVDVVRLDDTVDGAPTLIKMDIEGSELGALRGAERLIRTHRPRLAISAYHRSTDLLEISDYVLSLRPDYRIGLRHHTPVRWDTCLYFY